MANWRRSIWTGLAVLAILLVVVFKSLGGFEAVGIPRPVVLGVVIPLLPLGSTLQTQRQYRQYVRTRKKANDSPLF